MRMLLILILLIIAGTGVYFIYQNNSVRRDENPVITATPSSPIGHASKDAPQTEIIAQGLEVPWGFAFLPDGRMLITERPGRVQLMGKDGKLGHTPIYIVEQVKQIGEGGLHGIAVHPDFNTNKFIYLYYTYGQSGNQTLNRVVRVTFAESGLTNETVIVDKIPGAQYHDGGRIKFGPDKLLYITTGDALDPSLAQDRNSLAGKILRVTDEGKAAPGNPFNDAQGGSLSRFVYSYGHRNSQGIAWDEKGKLYSTEHGRSGLRSGLDEINLIEAGKNYGWEVIQGDQTRNGMVTPVKHSGNDTWAPASAAFYNNSLFFGGLKGEALYEAVISGNSVVLKEHFKGKYGRIREVVLGPDNMLYISTSNQDGRGNPRRGDDKIIRINPEKL